MIYIYIYIFFFFLIDNMIVTMGEEFEPWTLVSIELQSSWLLPIIIFYKFLPFYFFNEFSTCLQEFSIHNSKLKRKGLGPNFVIGLRSSAWSGCVCSDFKPKFGLQFYLDLPKESPTKRLFLLKYLIRIQNHPPPSPKKKK